MNTEDYLFSILETVAPTCFYSWAAQGSDVPKPPYICYLYDRSDNFAADNRVTAKIDGFIIELYIENTDYKTETELETALDECNIFYQKTAKTFIEELGLLQVTYDINLVVRRE